MPTVSFASPRSTTSCAVADLAALISVCAQLRAEGADGDGIAWAATAALLGTGKLNGARDTLRLRGEAWELRDLVVREVGEDALHARARRAPPSRPLKSRRDRCAPRGRTMSPRRGRDIVLSMLVVGLIFIAVIAIGQFFKWLGHRQH